MLNQVNVMQNNNKFYTIQVVFANNCYHCVCRWGRVGENGMNTVRQCHSVAEAVQEFKKKFRAKTKNDWDAVAKDFSKFQMEHPFYALIDDGRFAKEEKSVEVKESPKPQTNESTTTQESTRTTTTSDAEKPAPSRLLPNEVDYVIYHSPCSDGTTSGLIAWKYLQANFPDREVTYKGMSPGSRPPEGLEGKNVLICDLSFRKEHIPSLLATVNKLLILDHHKSAEKDLQDLPDVYKIFDMNKSGATLTWAYFHPHEPVPLFVAYIEDRDIWKKALPGTDDFFAVYSVLPHEFEVYDKFLSSEAEVHEAINTTGKKYQELNKINADWHAAKALPRFCRLKEKYYMVGYVNTSVLKSDIGNLILTQYPLVDFSACYSVSDYDDGTSFSLRSSKKHADVSKIATLFGGGGHAAASGVKINSLVNALPGKVYDHGEVYRMLETVGFYEIAVTESSEENEKSPAVEKFHTISVNASLFQAQIGAYLLQTKYKIQGKEKDDKTRVQVGCTLLRPPEAKSEAQDAEASDAPTRTNKRRNNAQAMVDAPLAPPLQLSALWHYNAANDSTKYWVTFDKRLADENKKRFVAALSKREGVVIERSDEKSIHFTLPTLVHVLAL